MKMHCCRKTPPKNRLVPPIFVVILFGLFLIGPAHAQDISFQSYQFSAARIYQGDTNVYVDLTVRNNANRTIVLHGAFVHFDWQAPAEFFIEGSQTAGQPFDLDKLLSSTDSHTCRITFSVPTSVTVAGHIFYFKVFYDDGAEIQWNPRAQDPFAELFVYSSYEPLYETLVTTVENKVTQASGAGFISPDARALFQRAQSHLDDAYQYAYDLKWQYAVSRLQSASSLIDQAYATEQTFRMYLIIGSIAAVGVIVGLLVYLRRRRKRAAKSE